MHRNLLLELLSDYQPIDDADSAACQRIARFVNEQPRCFERELSIGHVTGSAWVLDPAGQRVLLTHHKKLDKWLQLGGHCDGDPDVLRVALREAHEESGLSPIRPLFRGIFDLDVHPIPRQGEAADHFHYDIRFLVRADTHADFTVSNESHELRWFTADELGVFPVGNSVRRMRNKWLSFPSAGSALIEQAGGVS